MPAPTIDMTYGRYISLAFIAFALAGTLACHGTTETEPSTTPTSATYLAIVMPEALTMAVGDSTQLRSVAALRDGTYQIVTISGTWESSDSSVASVNEFGIVRAVTQGTADITVTLDGLTTRSVVTVGTSGPARTFWGTAAAAGGELATLTLSFAGAPRVSGTLFLKGTAVLLTGRIDAPTNIVNVAGGGYTFVGVLDGAVLSGTFVDPSESTGGYAAIDATRTAVTTFCGTYASDGTTSLGNADGGAFGLSVSVDGTVTAADVVSDASSPPQTFVGRREGDSISLTASGGATLAGATQSGTATGTFQTSSGSAATFSATSSACH